MAAPLESLSAQEGRKRFTIVEDIFLLREVLAVNPFGNSSRWDTGAANRNEALGRNFSVRGVRDHCDLLLGLFKRDDRTNLRKSGTEEQYTEKEQLLQDVADLAREFYYKVKPVPRKATATEEDATTTSTATLEPPERATATRARPATNRAARDAATTARVVAAAAAYRPVNHNVVAGQSTTRQKRYREHLGSLEKRAEEDRCIKKL
ncbi:hypothetical protein HPB47_006671 [Ixodes persulcatus]|uniref:Uncharacterized protein n=1 Tax=Ixodes persulcatus TaxID=34615 RepID=A0AC60PA77_IXOPE|nr:hypothetical protein HPB47_006671 [Ixodes persulcatus]